MGEPITRPEYEETTKRLEAEDARQNHRLDELESVIKQINELTTSISKLTLSVETMAKELTAQGERLEELEHRDGENWRNVMRYALTAGIGILVGYILEALFILS